MPFLKAIGVAEPQPWQLRFLGALRDGQLRSAANASRFAMGLNGPLPLAPAAPPCVQFGHRPDFIFIDEAGEFPKSAWDDLMHPHR